MADTALEELTGMCARLRALLQNKTKLANAGDDELKELRRLSRSLRKERPRLDKLPREDKEALASFLVEFGEYNKFKRAHCNETCELLLGIPLEKAKDAFAGEEDPASPVDSLTQENLEKAQARLLAAPGLARTLMQDDYAFANQCEAVFKDIRTPVVQLRNDREALDQISKEDKQMIVDFMLRLGKDRAAIRDRCSEVAEIMVGKKLWEKKLQKSGGWGDDSDSSSSSSNSEEQGRSKCCSGCSVQ